MQSATSYSMFYFPFRLLNVYTLLKGNLACLSLVLPAYVETSSGLCLDAFTNLRRIPGFLRISAHTEHATTTLIRGRGSIPDG